MRHMNSRSVMYESSFMRAISNQPIPVSRVQNEVKEMLVGRPW
jgi:hypothetical protein